MSSRFAVHLILSAALSLALCQSVKAQAVQLPTVQNFSVGTTVSVPDRGSAYLGGVSRASEGRVSRGVPLLGRIPGANRLFRNDAIGKATSASHMRVNATIIDLQEMDRAILASAAARRRPALSRPDDPLARRAGFISRNVASSVMPASDKPASDRGTPISSIAEVREANRRALETFHAEAREFLHKAEKAEADGKLGLAKIYYQMVARRTSGAQQQQVLARLEHVDKQRQTKPASRPLRLARGRQ